MLTCKVIEVQKEEIPNSAKEVLVDFSDLVPEKFGNEIPPVRQIEHAIDLVPGSSSPNLSSYHMSPREHAKLKRQVHELLSKGFL